eukprot:2800638-Rhodomonas_salina.1
MQMTRMSCPAVSAREVSVEQRQQQYCSVAAATKQKLLENVMEQREILEDGTKRRGMRKVVQTTTALPRQAPASVCSKAAL